MELKKAATDTELKMKAEMEQKRLELEKQFGTPITRHTPPLLVSGEQVLMQTALADTVNLETSKKLST